MTDKNKQKSVYESNMESLFNAQKNVNKDSRKAFEQQNEDNLQNKYKDCKLD